MISRRSGLTFSGMTARNDTPSDAHAIANAIEVDPLEASTTIVFSPITPVSTPWESTNDATRSLVEPLGKRYSSFNQMVHPLSTSSSGTHGVPPASRASQAFRCTSDMRAVYRWFDG